MKKLIVLLLLLTVPTARAQKLEAWLTSEAEENPQQYLSKAAKLPPATAAEAAGKFFVLGRCYANLNQEDIALKYYLLSKKGFEKLKLEEPAKDLALEIHTIISSQENYNKYGTSFIDEYYNYARKTGSNSRLALAWNEYAKGAYDRFDFETRNNPEVLDTAQAYFNKGLAYANKADDARARAKLYANLGTLENTRQNFSAARAHLDKAREFIKPGDEYELFVNYFSYGNSFFIEGNYSAALTWFSKAEKVKLPRFRSKAMRILFKKLMESYDAVDDQANRRIYQKLFLDLDNKIKDEDQNIAIHDINAKYQVAQNEATITALTGFKEKFYKNRLVFGILLLVVFLLALYSFIRWKKLDGRQQELEVEKQSVEFEKIQIEQKHIITVQELEKVKSLVTEGHIILKDKSKVYLNDLMYIKAEDHYLNVFSSDGKTNFVRGKLSQIILELPPNFVKCHRSYIVNTNFIQSFNSGCIVLKNRTELPVSRGFKL